MKLILRPMIAADRAFIAASWSASLPRPPEASFLTPAAWQTAVWTSVPTILDRPDVRVIVAADGESATGDADLFGWLAWIERPDGPPAVLFVYVKQAMRYDPERRTGPRIARRLFDRANIGPHTAFPYICSAADWISRLRRAGKIPNAQWCPDLVRATPDRSHHGRRESADA